MTNKLCFIIPYFGKFPNYFPLFLKSCETNENFNWLIFTDDRQEYNYPNNVKCIYMSFSDCKDLIKSKFECPVILNRPYKLCDLKPMYGYIFEEYIKQYRFWGHCDVDIIMGNLGKWLTDDFLEKYDKLFCLGHLTVYRNTPENNRIFMSEYKGCEIYKFVLSTPGIYTFDEEWKDNANICKIFEAKKKRCFKGDFSFNVACAYNKFRRIQYFGRDICPDLNGYKFEKYREALYLWDNGNLCRYYINNDEIVREEFLYMHLQGRKMKVDKKILGDIKTCFKIINDEFTLNNSTNIDMATFPRIKKHGICWHTQRILIKRIIKKINSFINIIKG